MKHNDIKALVAACVNYWENRKSNYLAGSAGEGSAPPRENNDYADGWGKEQAMNMDLESDQNKILGLLFFWMTFDLLINHTEFQSSHTSNKWTIFSFLCPSSNSNEYV